MIHTIKESQRAESKKQAVKLSRFLFREWLKGANVSRTRRVTQYQAVLERSGLNVTSQLNGMNS